jgi:DNA polymerase-3 subunit delta
MEQDLKSGSIDEKRVVLLCGAESFLTHFYERRLTARHEDPTGLDTNVFFADTAKDDEILAAAETFPMFAPRRVVVVKNAKDIGKPFADRLPALPETTQLIFTAGNVKKTATLYKAAAKGGAVYDFERLGDTDLFAFAGKRFKQAGLAFTPSVMSDFLARTGYQDRDSETDLFKVDGEATKLTYYITSEHRGEVTTADLDACMGVNLQTDVFALIDAVSAGDKAKAIRLLEYRLESGESPFALLPRIIDQFETMLGVREMGEKKGVSAQKMLELLPVRYDWQLRKLKTAASRIPIETLRTALHRLYAVEQDITGGNVPPRLALTLFIAEL